MPYAGAGACIPARGVLRLLPLFFLGLLLSLECFIYAGAVGAGEKFIVGWEGKTEKLLSPQPVSPKRAPLLINFTRLLPPHQPSSPSPVPSIGRDSENKTYQPLPSPPRPGHSQTLDSPGHTAFIKAVIATCFLFASYCSVRPIARGVRNRTQPGL